MAEMVHGYKYATANWVKKEREILLYVLYLNPLKLERWTNEYFLFLMHFKAVENLIIKY